MHPSRFPFTCLPHQAAASWRCHCLLFNVSQQPWPLCCPGQSRCWAWDTHFSVWVPRCKHNPRLPFADSFLTLNESRRTKQVNVLLCKFIGEADIQQASKKKKKEQEEWARLRGWTDIPSEGKILLELGIWISQLPNTSSHHHMLSRKHKPVPHAQPQRNALAGWRSLAGFGGKS